MSTLSSFGTLFRPNGRSSLRLLSRLRRFNKAPSARQQSLRDCFGGFASETSTYRCECGNVEIILDYL